MVVLTYEPLAKSAQTLVADAMRTAKTGEIATDSGAVILVDPTVDALAQDRVDAIRDALESAGVKHVDVLGFERTVEDGRDKLVEYLNAHPETTLVFGVDAAGILAADAATGVLKESHRYAIAGYSGEDSVRDQVLLNEYSAVGLLSIDKMMRRGVHIAGGILNGNQVSEKRPAGHHRSWKRIPTSGLPRMRFKPPEGPSVLKDPAKSPEK